MKSVSPHLSVSLAFVLGALSIMTSDVFAAPQDMPGPAVLSPLTKKQAPLSPWTLTFAGSAGVGQFQDIQVPFNQLIGTRADGKAVEADESAHNGVLLSGGASAGYRIGSVRLNAGLNLMQMSAVSGAPETQSSTYTRFDLNLGSRYLMNMGDYQAFVGADAGLRRSGFSNVSNGHYIEAALVGLRVGLNAQDYWSLEAYGSVAPVANFGFNSGKGFRGETFKKSSTSLMTMGARCSLDIRDKTWLDFGVEQERATVKLDDVNEYENFGLAVASPAQVSRVYNLVTTSVSFGFRKSL